MQHITERGGPAGVAVTLALMVTNLPEITLTVMSCCFGSTALQSVARLTHFLPRGDCIWQSSRLFRTLLRF